LLQAKNIQLEEFKFFDKKYVYQKKSNDDKRTRVLSALYILWLQVIIDGVMVNEPLLSAGDLMK
jgi:hypothetical protein